ncbi:hypothetical protein BREVNS_1671 [Brevinematales bacterium NS]|nr:hypothetical protein BREVNS_1671 [Brevinematales bacterium NS]
MFSSPIWVRGYAPLPRFFHLQGLICLFLFKGIVLFITLRNIFILFFVFYYFFETFAHSCKGLKKRIPILSSRPNLHTPQCPFLHNVCAKLCKK